MRLCVAMTSPYAPGAGVAPPLPAGLDASVPGHEMCARTAGRRSVGSPGGGDSGEVAAEAGSDAVVVAGTHPNGPVLSLSLIWPGPPHHSGQRLVHRAALLRQAAACRVREPSAVKLHSPENTLATLSASSAWSSSQAAARSRVIGVGYGSVLLCRHRALLS